jgi:putative isomerase
MIKKTFLAFTAMVFLASCLKQPFIDTTKIDSNADVQEFVLQGWNTWDNPDLLRFVYLPESFSLKLNFRTTFRTGNSAFMNEVNLYSKTGTQKIITPVAHSYDGRYIEMILNWQGMKARVQVAREKRDIMILYTPIEVPENPHLLILESGVLYNKPGRIVKYKGIIQADVSQKTFTVQSSSDEINYPLAIPGPYLCVNSDKETAFWTGYGRTLEKVKEYMETRKKIYEDQKARYGEMSEVQDAMRNLLGWNIIYDAANNRAITPVSRAWSESWGGYVLFDWDTYFTSAMFALDDKWFAYSNAIAITNSITPGGFIPNFTAAMENTTSLDRSQPPVGSLVCKFIYEKYRDKWFLEAVYDNLLTWNRWWDKARNNNGYLSWGSDPEENVNDDFNKQAAMYESGLDNSPLFDEAVFSETKHVLELASVDLMSVYIADCKALAFIAGELGKDNDKTELLERAAKFSSKLSELWDEKTGIYRDKDLVKNEFTKHLSPGNFYPLLAGVPTQQQAERMIAEHFMNPKEFYGQFMIPSISRNDAGFKDNDYWRGRIWGPMNFLVYLGLRNYDLPDARKVLADKSRDLIMNEWKKDQKVFENYNSVTGVGADVGTSDSFYSWGGLLALIPLMEAGYWK